MNHTTPPAGTAATANQTTAQATNDQSPIAKAVAGLKFRAIGPALMGGRITDIAVHPTKPHTWYVAAGSGGVWKTTNAGATWQAIFADQPSYSIGCITIDPTNPAIVWVGTGENVSGRHVGWGDGVYRSLDGGQTWQQMGLAKSEHIGRILVDPRDSNTVFVAATGPLWSGGGDRGLYKTSDGGASWHLVLGIDENTGVTDIAFAPGNPNTIYAAAHQRRRHIWSLLNGPGSGLYKSTDGGATWRRLKTGLPEGDMGKIGLAVTPAAPEVVYATIEANEKEKGFYRSTDRGERWEKRNAYISGGTGPHYYQIITASPHNADLVYQMDVFLHATRDGGKSFNRAESGANKHSDNHVLWIDPADGEHQLVGCDGGLYESFDAGESWRHFPNLPLSQFYRLALDNSQPFYNILGGAQDLGTLYGPSRTLNIEGVRSQDWYVPLGADGYHVAFDPTDPNTCYMEWQVGNLYRYDCRSKEAIEIQPQAAPGDPPERWNWDTPILISPHSSNRLYVAAQRLWRSDDRGDSWRAISPDLTLGRFRYDLALMGRVWSVDALYDNGAMSHYATITTLSESPVVEGLLYAGTDDGVIQVSEDGGGTWRKASALPGLPEYAFINGVVAAQNEADTVFAVADSHKTGDFTPYVFASNDRGQSWHAISGDLPAGTIVWALVQDHVQPDLLFLATEFGLYFTPNRGTNWYKLKGGVPTIAFRDLKLHRRDEDLVGASFGRGFFVLDDYSSLREVFTGALENRGHLFAVRDAWWYVPYLPMQSRGQGELGSSSFKAENPPFGAIFTYYLAEKALSTREARHKVEKILREQSAHTPFPGWEQLHREANENQPRLLLLVRDEADQPVRWLEGPAEAGLQRISWDLRLPPPDPIELKQPDFVAPWDPPPQGPLAAPGQYSVTLYLETSSALEALGITQSFTVKALPTTSVETDFAAVTAFQRATSELLRQVTGAGVEIGQAQQRVAYLRAALVATPRADYALFGRVDAVKAALADLERRLNGDKVREERDEPATPAIRDRVQRVASSHWQTRQAPTTTHRHSLALAQAELAALVQDLAKLIDQDLVQLEADLEAAGAPWTPGRRLVP